MVLLAVSAATPQSKTVLSSLGIDLWPDYDRPGVLVIYHAAIAPDVSLPTRLVFRIPAAAGLPNAVAEKLTDGQLITLPYDRTIDGETARIDLIANRPIVQLEYYDPAITRDGVRRSFAFTWPGDFEVQNFSVSVQQPPLASNLTTVPEATGVTASADGLTYHTLSRAGANIGETVEVQVSYEQASDQLSVETNAPVAAPVPTPAEGNDAASDKRTMRMAFAALFVSAAAVVVGLMVRGQRQGQSAPRSTPSPRTARSAISGGKATRFCTQCGAGADGGDRFCTRCDAALKA
jgi:hypothetical protein